MACSQNCDLSFCQKCFPIIAQTLKVFQFQQYQKMISFQNVKTVNCEESPCTRWGHSMISIRNQIFIFGGYEDSKYYNDLWRFDLTSLSFEKVEQHGQLPPPCSNFTLNYYQQQNSLLLFGGGTLNKEKLNTVYKLDVNTFTWSKYNFDQSHQMPWQRSYHCAEIIGHYLVVTGGQFFYDLDDTWVFNLNTNEWKQIKLSEGALKPKARKFASSFAHNNKFYIIGGCSGKYECVEDCFEMDFTQFLENQNMKNLAWKEVNFAGKELLVRWGHLSLVKENKAYVFGGRQGNKDHQNFIEIDLLTNVCKAINFIGPNPKGRRRPGLCINKNTFFCFSGFDGNYVKDFFYINLPANLDNKKINEDTQGINYLKQILTLSNAEKQINFEDEVFYVAEKTFKQIQKFLMNSKQEQPTKHFKDINYFVSMKNLVSKSSFFANFLNNCYESQQFNFYCPQSLPKEQTIIFKMFLSYFRFGKVIVQKCESVNRNKYFQRLLKISEYYCCDDLSEICKKQLLKFFNDEIIIPKSSIKNLLETCKSLKNINNQYENYAGYCILKKIVQMNRSIVGTLGNFKEYVNRCQEITDKTWIFKMITQHSFELSQLLIRKKEVDFENISSYNIQHKEEISHEKDRKGSMHFKNVNA